MTDQSTDSQQNPSTDFGGQGLRAEISWALYEWARNPYVILITIYIFAPYFTTSVASSQAEGQALIGYANSFAGLIVALSAPVLGAIADRAGFRKVPLVLCSLVLAIGTAMLWFAAPGETLLSANQIALLLGLTILAYEYTAVLHNSLLVAVAAKNRVGFASGLGLSLGNLGSLLLLVFILVFIALPGTAASALFGGWLLDEPLWGLDRNLGEDSRIAGPIVAIWVLIFLVPLLLYVKEGLERRDIGSSVKEGMDQLWDTVRSLSIYRNIGLFLMARMLYSDGKTAILIFGGVYAAATFDWGTLELVLYGIWLSVFAVLGGIVGAISERTFGPKLSIQLDIGATTLTVLLLLSLSPDMILFMPYEAGVPVVDWPIFNTLPEIIFLCTAVLLAIFITAAYASSRSMMAQIIPITMATKFFGLYALSGTATAFLGPLLVALFTDLTGSIRVGFSSAGILLVLGFIVMFFVREERSEESSDKPISTVAALRMIAWVMLFSAALLTLAVTLNLLWIAIDSTSSVLTYWHVPVGLAVALVGLFYGKKACSARGDSVLQAQSTIIVGLFVGTIAFAVFAFVHALSLEAVPLSVVIMAVLSVLCAGLGVVSVKRYVVYSG